MTILFIMNNFIFWIIFNIESEADQNFIVNLHVEYYGLMYKKAYEYVKNKYDAEDIVQQSYIKLIEQISTLKTLKRHTLAAYIVNTVRNISLNFIKTRNRDNNKRIYNDDYDDKNIIDSIEDEETPEKIFLADYDNEEIYNAINELNPKYKEILEYKYFENMSDKEIAQIMNITPDNVRKCLQRARAALKKILEKEYDYHGFK